jgi:cAMP-dependent protein kinase regulator
VTAVRFERDLPHASLCATYDLPLESRDCQGHIFYILTEGDAVATQQDGNGAAVQVKAYASGDYFGELALLRNDARAASVSATSECKCISLDKASFERLLGPVHAILARDAENYAKHV